MKQPLPPSPDSHAPSTGERIAALLLPLLLVAFLFALRILGPSNLTDNDQERPAAYILDAVRNGHWIIQKDWLGDIASKPPFYTWLAGAIALVLGRVDVVALYLPCALAMAGSAFLISWMAGRSLGPKGALLAGLFLVANPLTAKLVALARTDAVFTFGVTLTAVLAFRAATLGRSWIWPWLGGAIATLTKGPLGLILGFSGVISFFLERTRSRPRLGGLTQVVGAVLLVLLCGGWFLLAWREMGEPLIQKMIRSELVNHAIQSSESSRAAGFILTPAYFLSRFLPWSLLSVVGVWQAFRSPAADPAQRRLQRFALAWLIVGFFLFGAASHQRGDLVAPLIPAGAVLAVFPAMRWLERWTFRKLAASGLAAGLGLGTVFQLQHVSHHPEVFAETRGCRLLAEEVLKQGGRYRPLLHLDTPYALQFYLGTMEFAATPSLAAAQLRSGEAKAVAVTAIGPLAAALGADAHRLKVVAGWPDTQAPRLQIVVWEPPH
ncbi:MAG: glycosyltransferase family 39 protein [Verrucomicrobiales bacterium]|nr:glycosyltransferase family 39 protein [Verrucomicrobiales bacterium]